MRLPAVASWAHKWLALFVGVQVLLWIVSGLFFAVYPIERDHENFNTGLLIGFSIAALVMVMFGVVLIPNRFGWLRRRPG